MKSSKSSPKRTNKNSSDAISGFDLFYQLTYMSATAAAGIARSRIFDIARQVPAPPARYFEDINNLADKMRVNYPDACRVVGGRVKSEQVRTFLLRLADALRSGEPLQGFLERESAVQGDFYANEYERQLESLKKWDDAYVSIVISAGLVVIINMVSTMIYNVGTAMMTGMIFAAIAMSFLLAWVLSRAAPQELLSVKWSDGSAEQRRALIALKICVPLALVVSAVLALLAAKPGVIFIVSGLLLFPAGVTTSIAEGKVMKKDAEVGGFFRSVGGTASSRGTTLGQAIRMIEVISFPALAADIRKLDLRLRASARPETSWRLFGKGTGSNLISQATRIFFEATNLGGDAETAGILCSLFASRTAMLRAKRQGIAATFGWLTIVMHAVVAALVVFILEILKKFLALMQTAIPTDVQVDGMQRFAGQLMSFSAPQTQLIEQITIALVLMLTLVNAFAIVASEGTHILKGTFYVAVMLFASGVAFLVVPMLVRMVL